CTPRRSIVSRWNVMAGSAARSSTTSATSAERPRASKKSAKAEKPSAGDRFVGRLFAELARIAELSVVERRLRDFGFRAIAGTDEVGRGCLAGPVVAACVILDHEPTLFRVNDSKLIDRDHRTVICAHVLAHARAVAIGVMEPETIDRVNILRASKLAMQEAVENLPVRPDVLLLDAVLLETLDMPQVPLIEGDRRGGPFAAAPIGARVTRVLLMESYNDRSPVYAFRQNGATRPRGTKPP